MMTPTLIESISSASSVFPSPLDAALAYARRAWPVLPLHPVQEGRCGCRRSCTHPGKHPIGTLVPQGFKNATTNDETIREWWGRVAEANVGIRTGKESGLVVLDVDPRHGGEQTLSTLLASHGSLAATLEVVTGSGGQHLYFKHPGVPVGTRAHALGTGLDLKGDGGYVVAPPSLHIEGARYHWTEQWDAVTLAPLPAWMLEHVANGNRCNGVVVSKDLPNQIGPGHRNETLYRLGRSVYARGLSGAGVTAALLTEWPDVDMRRREFKLRETKNGEPRIVPMTPEVYKVFTELWQERVLHTQRVFPVQRTTVEQS